MKKIALSENFQTVEMVAEHDTELSINVFKLLSYHDLKPEFEKFVDFARSKSGDPHITLKNGNKLYFA